MRLFGTPEDDALTARCQRSPATSSASNLNELFRNAWRHWVTMLRQALKVAFYCLADVFDGFGARLALGNAAGQGRTGGDKHPILVLLQIDAILHHTTLHRSMDERNRNIAAWPA